METLLIGSKDRLDFGTPIPMSKKQQDEFLELLRGMYEPVDMEYVSEFREARLGSREINARWTAKEYRILLQLEDYETVARKLGRTNMSVIMHTGKIVPKLMMWCEDKDVSISQITLQDIETFLKEIEDKKLERRKQRKLRNEITHRIDKMTSDEEEPCMVGDPVAFGGECKNGFHDDCIKCPRSKGFIKTKENIALFNKVRVEDSEE